MPPGFSIVPTRLFMAISDNRSENLSLSVSDGEFPKGGKALVEDPQNYLGTVGAVIISLQIVLGFLGNTLVILAVLMTKSLRKSYNAFIVTLAVTDILFTVLVMPFYVETFVYRGWRLSHQLCIFHTYFGVILEIGSVWQISAIAFYRYLLIVHPHLYNKFSSPPKTALVTVGIFVFSILVILPNLFQFDGEIAYSDQLGRCNYVRRESKITLYWFFCAAYIPSGLCMLLCYLQIVRALKDSKARINVHIELSKSRRLSDPVVRASRKTSRKDDNRCRNANRLALPPVPVYLIPQNTTSGSMESCDNLSKDGSISTLKVSQDSISEELFRQRAMTWPGSQSNVQSGETHETQVDSTDTSCNNGNTTMPLVSRRAASTSPTRHQHAHSFRMIVVIFMGFVLTYMPFTIVNLADVQSCFSRTSYMITSLIFWMGVCVNPFIYGAMNKNFLQAYKTLLSKCLPKHTRAAWF